MNGIVLLPLFGRNIVINKLCSTILGHPKCSQSRALVLNRYMDMNGRLVTKRLHVIYQDVPSFVSALIGNVVTYAGEESIVDPKEKTLTIRTRNLNLTSIACVKELCNYSVCTDDRSKTEYYKKLEVQGWMTGLLNCSLEKWFIDTDIRNRGNGINVMDEINGSTMSFILPFDRDVQ